jgi:hypothetical protein
MTIEDLLVVYRHRLHLPDPAVVEATCATVTANRVAEFDPLWTMVVGASGSGKTEALNATSRLAGVHPVASLTEASLLSGSPSKDHAKGATGGLLREIGAAGIIVVKDFGAILSLHREARAGVLAALREVYNGAWTRRVGADGGRRLEWQGRIGMLAGATTVIDQHHQVMSQLGERFLMYRLQIDNAAEQGRRSLAHHGLEREMRLELAEATAALLDDVDLDNPPPLTPADTERLVSLAVLVARARSPVVRDVYGSRDIELPPEPEAPGRLVGALARLLTGLRMIGVDEHEAWRVTVETGLGSMPAVRRGAIELLVSDSDEQWTTTNLARLLRLPNKTTHRTLEDLAALELVLRTAQGQGKADLWRCDRWTAARYAESTSPEMSETSPHKNTKHVNDDFSVQVTDVDDVELERLAKLARETQYDAADERQEGAP